MAKKSQAKVFVSDSNGVRKITVVGPQGRRGRAIYETVLPTPKSAQEAKEQAAADRVRKAIESITGG